MLLMSLRSLRQSSFESLGTRMDVTIEDVGKEGHSNSNVKITVPIRTGIQKTKNRFVCQQCPYATPALSNLQRHT